MYVGSKNATRRSWRGSNVNYEHNAAAWPRCSPAEHLGAVPASPWRTGLCKPLSRRPPEASGSHEGWGTVLQAAPLTRLLRAWENPSTGEAIPLDSVSTQPPFHLDLSASSIPEGSGLPKGLLIFWSFLSWSKPSFPQTSQLEGGGYILESIKLYWCWQIKSVIYFRLKLNKLYTKMESFF